MKYLLILDSRSAVGAIYASGKNDGIAGDSGHPILDCSEIDTTHPHLLFAKRVRKEGAHQSIYVPYSALAFIHQYAEEEPMPLGFKLS